MFDSRQGSSALRFALGALGVLAVGIGFTPPARAVSTTVVISQVYGGGGNTGAPYHNDYIEIFNLGSTTVDLTGWTVQYASATGSGWSTTALAGSIAPGSYYLVQEGAGAGGGASLPTPDATGSIAMSATSAKVALVSNATALTGTCPTGGAIVDLVGYGSASCSETAPTPGLGNTTAALRDNGGCAETDDNASDFSELAPAPRNSASALHACQYTLTVTVDPPAGGTVARSPDQPTYQPGSSVDLTATPAFGYHFVRWTGDASGSANPLSVFMDGDKVIVAHFALNVFAGVVAISQIYGGGGNAGAPYQNDFIELFNRGNAPADVTGWSVQYASSEGTVWFTTTLVGTIPPGGYYLVEQAAGGGIGGPLPTPDAIGTIALSANDGKLALVDNNVTLTGGCPTGGGIVDLVGYGGADCSETEATASFDNVTAGFRLGAGCQDTDDNAFDFTVGAPAPRNSATAVNICTEWVGVDPGGAEFALGAPAPNPVRGALRVPFVLARDAEIRLKVLDVQGRVIATLAEGGFTQGRHQVIWSGATATGPAKSGVYFVRLQVSGRVFVRRVAITR